MPWNSIDSQKLSELMKDGWSWHGSGGSSGGGGGVCIVKVSCDMTMSDNGTPTCSNIVKDKTFAELKAAYDADGLLWCRLHTNMQTDMGNMPIVGECPLYGSSDTEMAFWPLGYLNSELGLIVTITSDDVCDVYVD